MYRSCFPDLGLVRLCHFQRLIAVWVRTVGGFVAQVISQDLPMPEVLVGRLKRTTKSSQKYISFLEKNLFRLKVRAEKKEINLLFFIFAFFSFSSLCKDRGEAIGV